MTNKFSSDKNYGDYGISPIKCANIHAYIYTYITFDVYIIFEDGSLYITESLNQPFRVFTRISVHS